VSAVQASHALTAPVGDYLKAIYDLERAGQPATTNEIAMRLAISPASVSGMVRRLADQGLIRHEPYRGVRLTASGKRAALRTIRRHRILECYLAEVLGYSWDRVHEEAERLEHAASDELIDKMAEAIGNPRYDPHGAPIPTSDGEVEEGSHRSLSEVGKNKVARVQRVHDEDGSRLRYLDELGIRPGTRVRIIEKAPFDGPITFKVEGGRSAPARAIAVSLAQQVFVEADE
jgi:DtxR family transcriptional regulator, Mn-dependent transcriptional regulator